MSDAKDGVLDPPNLFKGSVTEIDSRIDSSMGGKEGEPARLIGSTFEQRKRAEEEIRRENNRRVVRELERK